MEFKEAQDKFYQYLATHKIMAIASSNDDYPMIRNVSVVIIDNRIYFKSDKNFKKTKQLLNNNKVSLCFHGLSFEGVAINKGLLVEKDNKFFIEYYEKYWQTSYNAYIHEDSDILIEVVPKQAEIWDQDENDYAFQIIIDFEKEEVKLINYD